MGNKDSPMPIISPLSEVLIPEQGYGVLKFYQDILTASRSVQYIYHFYCDPWDKNGKQPFMWNYFPASGKLKYSTIVIVASRSVRIEQEIIHQGQKQKVPVGKILGLVYDSKNPLILVYRPQDNNLIPKPGEIIEPDRIIGMPQIIGPDPTRFNITELTTVQVVPYEKGMKILHNKGGYEIDIRIIQRSKPAAYAYEIDVAEDENSAALLLSFVLKIVHTENVDIKIRGCDSFKDFVFVYVAKSHCISSVPPQGAILSDKEFRFERKKFDEVMPCGERSRVITLLEMPIYMIPFVGWLYYFGQLYYSYVTGKNFWGYHVEKDEVMLGGMLGIILLGWNISSILQSIINQRNMQIILKTEVLEELRYAVDVGFIKEVGKVNNKTQLEFLQLLQKYESGAINFTVLLTKFNDVVGNAYIRSIEQALLDKVFSRDFSSFSHVKLSQAYNKYKLKPKLKKHPDLALDPASWAKRQTKGPVRAMLVGLLGEDFVGIINRAILTKKLPRITQAEINLYDKLAGLIEDYGTLRNMTAKLPRFGEVFEIDHLLEQRFWRNNPNLVIAFDEIGSGMAFIVPKNEAIAAKIFQHFGGKKIRYVHTTKTRMLNQLIPGGAEAFFSVQEICDAHIFVLNSLGAHPSVIKRMLVDMHLMAKELGQNFKLRIPKAEHFLPENGWPIVTKDPSKKTEWIIIRQ